MTREKSGPTPYRGSADGPVSAWSRRLYLALSKWDLAAGGQWVRWDREALELRITDVEGEAIDPIVIYTARGALQVQFGESTETFYAATLGSKGVVEAAIKLVDRWLAGEFKTLVFLGAWGQFCSLMIVHDGDLNEQISPWIKVLSEFRPVKAELRSPRQADWVTFPFVEGRLID